MHPKVAELVIHPIKSCRGVSVRAARVGPRGLEGDRRYMLVDTDGRFLTQREHPRMALIGLALDGDAFLVTAPGREPLVVPRALDGALERRVRVWRSELDAAVADDDVNGWFSEYLGFACSLVYMTDGHHRAVTHPSARDGDEVGFADDSPLLLISTASLADLNTRLERPVAMRRFRPNLVVTAERPFAEDEWGRIRIGGVQLDVGWPCKRCVLTTVDPETGKIGRAHV